MSEWPPDVPFQGLSNISLVTNAGVSLAGFVKAPLGTGYWNMNNGMLVVQPSVNPALSRNWHSGIGVSQPCVRSFCFSYNMAMEPSPFWAMTREYGFLRPVSVELTVSPKRVRPWNPHSGGAMIATTSGYLFDGTMQADANPGLTAPPDGAGTQFVSTGALTSHRVRTWSVHIPRSVLRNRWPTPGSTGYNGFFWENFYQWMVFGQTDLKQGVRPDDLLRRCPVARLTHGGAYIKRRFFQGKVMNFPEFDQHDGAAVSGSPGYFSGPGLGLTGELVPSIPIIGLGYYPAWWTPSASESGLYPWTEPMNVPLLEFVVDSNEWQGTYAEDQPAPAIPLGQCDQDFTKLLGALPANPTQQCPPMEWDVWYHVTWEFSGLPNAATGQRLAMS